MRRIALIPPETHTNTRVHTDSHITHTWGENQLLWHFISLFAVAIETGLAEKDGLCGVFAFDAGVASITELAWVAEIPKAFSSLFNHFTRCWCPLQSSSTRPELIFTPGTFLMII